MLRLDTSGRDVTDLPALWRESDCEIVATNFHHPTITEGQHTNGPAAIWIRQADVGDWIDTGSKAMHLVRGRWIESGLTTFQTAHVQGTDQ